MNTLINLFILIYYAHSTNQVAEPQPGHHICLCSEPCHQKPTWPTGKFQKEASGRFVRVC